MIAFFSSRPGRLLSLLVAVLLAGVLILGTVL